MPAGVLADDKNLDETFIFCHMLSSVDGRIGGNALDAVIGETSTRQPGEVGRRGLDLWSHNDAAAFRRVGSFVTASKTPAGPQAAFVARRADSHAISVDMLGKHGGRAVISMAIILLALSG